jgi:integrase
MMLFACESPLRVTQQMGHSDWGMIRQICGKFMPDAVPDAGEKAVKIFSESCD